MKSILQSIALLSAATLIASCDSSSGGGSAGVGTTPPVPQVSVTGTAVKGIIDGGAVTVFDADGDQVGTGTTTAGVYDVTYDASIGNGVITPPLRVTVTGGSTVCDFDIAGTANDCRTGDPANPFAAFGQPYDLASDFVVRSLVVAVTNGDANNTSAATELAVLEALQNSGDSASAISVATASQSNAAIAGLIETITGISLGGLDVTQIGAADLTATGGSPTSASLALAAFNAGVLAAQADGETLTATLARLASQITIDPATGNIAGTGTQLAVLANALAEGLRVAATASGNAAVGTAASAAARQAQAYTNIGNQAVTVVPPAAPGSEGPVDLTVAFIETFGAVLSDVLDSTGAQAFGGQENASATEAFATELDAIAGLTSENATIAFSQLDAALKTAAGQVSAESPTVTNAIEEGDLNDGIEFVLTRGDDGTLTVTGVSSSWPKMSTAENNQVTLTGATGTATSTAISIPEVTLTSRKGTAVAQTFVGSFDNTVNADGTNTANLTGTVTGATAGTSFAITGNVTNSDDSNDNGTYSVRFDFLSPSNPNLTLTLNGSIGELVQNYAINTPSGTISGTVTRPTGTDGASDTITLTDGTATLTLTLVNGQYTGGTLTVGETETGTVDADGTVTYTNGNIQSLTGIIF